MIDLRCTNPNCSPNKYIRSRLLATQLENDIGNILVIATTNILNEEYSLRLDTKCPSCKRMNSIVIK
jgi:hypothetical protein